jgi:hypothetical protein
MARLQTGPGDDHVPAKPGGTHLGSGSIVPARMMPLRSAQNLSVASCGGSRPIGPRLGAGHGDPPGCRVAHGPALWPGLSVGGRLLPAGESLVHEGFNTGEFDVEAEVAGAQHVQAAGAVVGVAAAPPDHGNLGALAE